MAGDPAQRRLNSSQGDRRGSDAVSQYERTRAARAFEETKKFWNIHRTWAQFVPALVGLLFGVLRNMSKTLIDTAVSGLVWALCFYVMAWAGSFLINYLWFVPVALHREQQSRIGQLQGEIDRLQQKSVTIDIIEGFF